MGKTTISMAIFNSYVTNYQRVIHLYTKKHTLSTTSWKCRAQIMVQIASGYTQNGWTIKNPFKHPLAIHLKNHETSTKNALNIHFESI